MSNTNDMTVQGKPGGTARTGTNRYAAMSVEPDASQPVQWGIDSVQNPTFDTAYPLTAGMRFTAAGNVSVVMKNGETFVWPVFAGDMLPIRGTEVTTANTTITNTQIQLLY